MGIVGDTHDGHTQTDYRIPTMGALEADHAQIEGAIAVLVQINPNLECCDAELGEWAILGDATNGDTVTITIVSEGE